MNNHAQRLTEIKARAEVRSCLCAREDVPFLLAQLEQASTELAVFRAKTHDEQLSAALKLVGVGNDRISRAAEMGLADAANAARIEVGFELRDLAKKLAASEAAAGQMRAALEDVREWAKQDHVLQFDDGDISVIDRCSSALAADAGKDWISPEEADRREAVYVAMVRQHDAETAALREEAERLRKENADLKIRMPRTPFDVRCADALAIEVSKLVRAGKLDSRSPAADALLDYTNGEPTKLERYVSEEECARRCREVVEACAASVESLRSVPLATPSFLAGVERAAMRIRAHLEKNAPTLLDGVAKGGAR